MHSDVHRLVGHFGGWGCFLIWHACTHFGDEFGQDRSNLIEHAHESACTDDPVDGGDLLEGLLRLVIHQLKDVRAHRQAQRQPVVVCARLRNHPFDLSDAYDETHLLAYVLLHDVRELRRADLVAGDPEVAADGIDLDDCAGPSIIGEI